MTEHHSTVVSRSLLCIPVAAGRSAVATQAAGDFMAFLNPFRKSSEKDLHTRHNFLHPRHVPSITHNHVKIRRHINNSAGKTSSYNSVINPPYAGTNLNNAPLTEHCRVF